MHRIGFDLLVEEAIAAASNPSRRKPFRGPFGMLDDISTQRVTTIAPRQRR